MTVDRSLTQDQRLAFVRRELEKGGGQWNGTVTASTLFLIEDGLLLKLDDQAKRIAELVTRIEGMQKNVDHAAKHALVFMGEFQDAMSYAPGHLVRFKGATFTALRDILPGKSPPDRNGSGWTLVV